MRKLYYPEDKLPLSRLIPMGIQHVVAMFGAIVLAVLMNLVLSPGGEDSETDKQDHAGCVIKDNNA